jgi:putative transposase
VSAATIYTWKSRFGGLQVSDAHKLKGLEDETRRLKHLVADLRLDKEVPKVVIQKNGWSLPA